MRETVNIEDFKKESKRREFKEKIKDSVSRVYYIEIISSRFGSFSILR